MSLGPTEGKCTDDGRQGNDDNDNRHVEDDSDEDDSDEDGSDSGRREEDARSEEDASTEDGSVEDGSAGTGAGQVRQDDACEAGREALDRQGAG